MADHEILEIARKIRMDLTGMQAKLSELMRLAALLVPADPADATCGSCGLVFGGPLTLAEHVYVQHDGPEPAHWLDAELLAESTGKGMTGDQTKTTEPVGDPEGVFGVADLERVTV